MLQELRERWKGGTQLIIAHSSIQKADIRWALDFIALSEIINSPKCKTLKIIKTRTFDSGTEKQLQAENFEVGLFDYAWEVDVCGNRHIYRVANKKGTMRLVVNQVKL